MLMGIMTTLLQTNIDCCSLGSSNIILYLAVGCDKKCIAACHVAGMLSYKSCLCHSVRDVMGISKASCYALCLLADGTQVPPQHSHWPAQSLQMALEPWEASIICCS